MNSSYYNDSGCPGKCISENDYSTINGAGACPVECLSGYANPNSTISCPANCNYYETYSTIGGIYDMYIPASTKSRLIPQQSVTDNFVIQNDRITNFAGNVMNVNSTSNLDTGATTASVLDYLSKLQNVNQQLIAVTKTAQNDSKISQAAANQAPVVIANQGPASATINSNTSSTAANNASSNAAAATNLAAQASDLADKILQSVQGLPQTPEVQNAIQAAETSKKNAIDMSDAANAAAADANGAAAQANQVIASALGNSNTTEGFRFRSKNNISNHLKKMQIHNRLRNRSDIGSYTGMM
jgi:hypothetical protein